MSAFIESPLNNLNTHKTNRGMLARALNHFSSDSASSSTSSQNHNTPSAVVILPAPPYTSFQQTNRQRNTNRGLIGPLPLHNPLNASTATTVKVEMPLVDAFPTTKRPYSQNSIRTPQLTHFATNETRKYSPEEWRIRLRNGILSTALLKTDRSYSFSVMGSDLKSFRTPKLQPSKSMSNVAFEMDPDDYRTGILGKSLSKLNTTLTALGTTNTDDLTTQKQGYLLIFFNHKL